MCLYVKYRFQPKSGMSAQNGVISAMTTKRYAINPLMVEVSPKNCTFCILCCVYSISKFTTTNVEHNLLLHTLCLNNTIIAIQIRLPYVRNLDVRTPEMFIEGFYRITPVKYRREHKLKFGNKTQ
jgi:hypothetical protein